MNIPLNIGKEAAITVTLSEVLQDPARHLVTGTDPALGIGQLAPRGAGSAVTGVPVVLLLLRGTLNLTVAGEASALVAEQSALRVNAGVALAWEADASCALVVISHPALSGQEALSRINLATVMSPSASPPPSVLLTDAPQCKSAVLQEAFGLTFGLWEATPYARRGIVMGFSEVMYLLEGQVTLSTPDGTGFDFAAGDVLLAPEGVELAWESAETVRKFFLSVTR